MQEYRRHTMWEIVSEAAKQVPPEQTWDSFLREVARVIDVQAAYTVLLRPGMRLLGERFEIERTRRSGTDAPVAAVDKTKLAPRTTPGAARAALGGTCDIFS
jgi:hypothetical protein